MLQYALSDHLQVCVCVCVCVCARTCMSQISQCNSSHSTHRLIYDPATGRPRGFGFCEYEDGETAMSAVRNLAGKEVSGRPLRIDSAMNAPGGEFRGPGELWGSF